jgi:Reverse transcriptase (RNA-dependent DNA polymerase).
VSKEKWNLLQRTVYRTKLRWAINSFDPYKSAGPDLTIPAFLQHGIDVLSSLLCSIFRACIALAYIPTVWRKARITFIPKPGKPSYTEASAYRAICLSSFLLKTLEILVDRHIRDDVLRRNPLHINQHAYQSGKSTDTALNSVVSTIENELKTQEIALGAFLDIEGAFDRTSIEAISSDMGFRLFLRDGSPPC